MRIIYFDEVKYKKGSQPYYWLGALVATPEAIWRLENKINDLSEKIFGDRILSNATEFHAADIFHRKANFKEQSDIEARIDVLKSLMDIIDEESELEKVIIRVAPEKISANDNHEDIAFMFMVEKTEQHLRSVKSPGLLIGDRENATVSKQFAEKLSHFREHGTKWDFGMDLTHLIDTVHFTNSHHSRMLQLADIYVWVKQLCQNSSEAKHPNNLVIQHAKHHTNILTSTKYKIWPPQS